VWESEKAYKAGYATVTLFEMGGKKCLAAFPADGLVVIERGTGKEISFYPWKTNYDVNSVTPLYTDGKLFISSDYGVGCALVEAATGKELWKNKSMCNHYTTCILVDGFLYGINGAAGLNGVLTCMDLKDGSVKWTHKGLGTGSLMMADGKLIVQGAAGDLVIAEVNPKEFKQLAAAKPLAGECWTMPVLSNGMIYCRNTDGDLVALDVSGK
jgi:outer membrane protein assembly factor BamB